MLKVKTSGGITKLVAEGEMHTLLADLGVIAAAVLSQILRDEDDETIDYYCSMANLTLLKSVQHARERVKNHD